ncbi:amidohydrolase [Virgibacillus phasianinus]|uniref:Amidohydrolase n=1 Tax=Virgibacillus phasianinus TaxID=2017483 RepID=A0A220U2Q6_9BACI|nr:M20 peptidase aminoacylase family protein [Virgibacillus phasianinus]ASK62564.1 amidohydrolase [Virgibacillus phasianinus]
MKWNTINQRIQETFTFLHGNAEISWKEHNTTKYVANILKESGCRVTTFDDCTGVIGEFGHFTKGLPIVAIRADMDALWQEVNGVFQANHSCGHDAHMAMVLGLLWALKENPELHDQIAVKFIFQPAEEKSAGALKMVEKGGIDNVDYLFGIHLRPAQETQMGYATPVIVHGATRKYRATIKGHDAHGARPHLNHNAIEIGAQLVDMMNNIHLDPRIPHTVKMTSFHAGGESINIIPGSATFSVDMRAQSNELINQLEKKVQGIFTAISDLYDISISVDEVSGVVAAKTNKEAIGIMKQAIGHSLGAGKIAPPLVTPGGDDFHYYTIKKPALKATMVGLGCNLKPGLHHPAMTFNKTALLNGVKILYHAILQTYGIKK